MLPEINLLPKYNRQNSVGYILFLIGLIVALLGLVFIALYYFYLRGTVDDVSSQLTAVQTEQETLEAQLAQMEVQDEADEFIQAYNYVNDFIIPTSYFVDDLMFRLPANSYLSRYDYEDQVAEVEIEFETMNATAAYVESLHKSDFVRDVKVDEMLAFEHQIGELPSTDAYYETMPRYTVIYTLEIDAENLQWAGEADE